MSKELLMVITNSQNSGTAYHLFSNEENDVDEQVTKLEEDGEQILAEIEVNADNMIETIKSLQLD